MGRDVRWFSTTARGLAKNPLGVIALFIVLVYGLAALVTAFGSVLSAAERLPLVWFLVLFPLLVLAVFGWLVCWHSEKLYAPSDFRDEGNFLRTLRRLETGAPDLLDASEGSSVAEANMVVTPSLREDSQLAIAKLRIDLERELFLLSRHSLGRRTTESQPMSRSLDELESKGTISHALADSLLSFVGLANTAVHQPGIAGAQIERCIGVGSALVARLRHKRLVVEAEFDFDGHGLWHMHRHLDETQKKYYYWSAVAATLPVFDYDYDVYSEAAENHNKKARQRADNASELYILPLDEFVGVLEFRERELLRLIQQPRPKAGSRRAWNEWQWPSEWGDLGWNGPILREKVHHWGAEEDLLRTRTALARHRRRLQRETRSHLD
jgi:hypothetical protein